jgi:hypothetical protein
MSTTALQRRAFITVGGETILIGSEHYEMILETLTVWTEGITEEKIARYKLDVIDDAEWSALISDKAVISDVLQGQHERRLSGASTQALARTFYAKGPRLLDTIANDATQPARTRIDALRELRMQSGFATAEDGAMAGQKFTLTINVGEVKTQVGGPVIDVTQGPHNLTSGVTFGGLTSGPTIDASGRGGVSDYDRMGAPPRGGEYPSNTLDEITAGIEAYE